MKTGYNIHFFLGPFYNILNFNFVNSNMSILLLFLPLLTKTTSPSSIGKFGFFVWGFLYVRPECFRHISFVLLL